MKIKIVFLCLIVAANGIRAEEIFIPDNRLEINISNSDMPFSIAGQRLKDGKAAAEFISYLFNNWSSKEKPVLVVEKHTKVFIPSEQLLYSAIAEVSGKWKVRVIHMPEPSGMISASSMEALTHMKNWRNMQDTEQ